MLSVTRGSTSGRRQCERVEVLVVRIAVYDAVDIRRR
jgi:hypothetical protein